MPPKKSPYINVDDLMPQVRLEDLAHFYGFPLPDLKRIGGETRAACFLNCGKPGPTGDRALAIQEGHPAKQWHCHQYECGRSGNLVSLIDLVKPGDAMDGRPRGERFKAIAADLKSMAGGRPPEASPAQAEAATPLAAPAPPRNVPLKDSPNERARGLVRLDEKFLADPKDLPPKASAYLRRRPFLSLEVCRTWRLGYLPRDTGEDKSGGILRGMVVYPYFDELGELLCWFGRDPLHEDKHAAWLAGGKQDKEPEKFHFVKGFLRGQELWGQERLKDEANHPILTHLGLILVEGPNDAIRLNTLGVPAVALCSNQVTEAQARKAARLATELGNGVIALMLDNDEAGDAGLKQALPMLARFAPVRLVWSRDMHEGRFKDRQPESLSMDEWNALSVSFSPKPASLMPASAEAIDPQIAA